MLHGDFPIKHLGLCHADCVRNMWHVLVIGKIHHYEWILGPKQQTSKTSYSYTAVNCVCCFFLYIHVLLGGKNVWGHHAVYHLKSWTSEIFRKTGMNIIHGHAVFQKLVLEKQQWFNMWCVFFFSVTDSMAFIVKCAPVLKEWRFCCCSCSLRAAAVVQAWIVTVSPFKLRCCKWRESMYGQKFWVIIYLGYQKRAQKKTDGTVKTSVASPGYSAAYQFQKDCKTNWRT